MSGFLARAARMFIIFYELVKFEHTIFALPFAYIGVFIAAGGWPSGRILLWVTVAMAAARTAAMALNRVIDRHLDARNPRTRHRLLPRGVVSPRAGWALAAAATLVFVVAAAQLNALALKLLPLALMILTVYPYTKRFSWLSHFVLGSALACAPVGGWVAVTGELPWQSLLLAAVVILWVAGFDVIYALQDIDFDRREGLHSIPARLGVAGGLRVARWLHLFTVVVLFATWWLLNFGTVFLAGVLFVAGLLLYEHSLVKADNLERLNLAFFVVNGAVSILLFAFVLADVLLKVA